MRKLYFSIILLSIIFISIKGYTFEIIDGEQFPDKISRDVSISSAQEKSDLRSCKGSDKFNSIWIYKNKSIIDIYTKCRVLAGGYQDYLMQQSFGLARKHCAIFDAKPIYRGKALHIEELAEGLFNLLNGNLRTLGVSYVCRPNPKIVNDETGTPELAVEHKEFPPVDEIIDRLPRLLILFAATSLCFLLVFRYLQIRKKKIKLNKPSFFKAEYFVLVSAIFSYLFIIKEIADWVDIGSDELVYLLGIGIPAIIFIYSINRKRNYSNRNIQVKTIHTNVNIGNSGSGFFINANGYMITNNHVLSKSKNAKIIISGKEYESKIIATDQVNDLTVIKVKIEKNNFFSFADKDPQRLDRIIAVGFGFGKNFSGDVKVTSGVVSALSGFSNNSSHIQIDAAIQSGNSGGPVINDNGCVVGIAVAKLDAMKIYNISGSIPENVNYAIKISTLKKFLKLHNIDYNIKSETEIISKKETNKLIDTTVAYIKTN